VRLDVLFLRLDNVRLRCGHGTLFFDVRFDGRLGSKRTLGGVDRRRRFSTLFFGLTTAHDDGRTTLHHGPS
jgi:hypothetical protein